MVVIFGLQSVSSYNGSSDVFFFLQVLAPFMLFTVLSKLDLSLCHGMSKTDRRQCSIYFMMHLMKKSGTSKKVDLSKALSVWMLLLCFQGLKKLFIIVARDKIGTLCKCLFSSCVLLRTGLDRNLICDPFVCDYICYGKCGII